MTDLNNNTAPTSSPAGTVIGMSEDHIAPGGRRLPPRVKQIAGIVAGLVIVVVLGFFGLKFWQNTQIASTSENFIDLLLEGKEAEAYELTSDDFKGAQTVDEFAQSMGDLQSAQPIKTKPQIFKKDGATYYFQHVEGLPMTVGGKTDGYFTLILVNEGGWKIRTAKVE